MVVASAELTVASVAMAPWAVALVKTGGIPRTSSGKVRRQAARQLFLTDELPCLRVWRKKC